MSESQQRPFLEGKVALVTGATRGIGRAIAESLAAAGASVALCGRNAKLVEETVAELKQTGAKVFGAPLDVRSESAVSDFFNGVKREFGGLDILVNNAGIGIFRSVADLSIEDWKATLETNLNGVFFCSREAVPLMRQRGAGYIINISSLAGRNAFAGGSAYNASKFGLNGFSEALMLDHRYENIRVSYVMPGSVDTDFSPRSARAAWKIAPQDVADVVLMLLSMPERTTVSRIEMRPSLPPK